MPESLLELLLTNSPAAISEISSDLAETPVPSWVSSLPTEVRTYFITSIQAAGTTAALFLTSYSFPSISISSYSFPSISISSYSFPSISISSYSFPTFSTVGAGQTASSYSSGSHNLPVAAITWIVLGSLLFLFLAGSGLIFLTIMLKRQSDRRRIEQEQARAATAAMAGPAAVTAQVEAMKTRVPSMMMMVPQQQQQQQPVYQPPAYPSGVVELRGDRQVLEMQGNYVAPIELPGQGAPTPMTQLPR
jgi:hypothetical protein